MKPSFNRRKATSFGLLLSFSILFVTGVILWIFPYLTGLSSLQEFGRLTKQAWLTQHIVFGILFTLLSLYHLFGVNREPFFSYLKKSTSEGCPHRPELLTTLLSTVCIVMVTTLHLQPFSGSLTTSNEIFGAFERKEEDRNAFYEQRAELTERPHHHHFDDDFNKKHTSPQLADCRDTAGVPYDTHFSAEYRNDSPPANSDAPDDELHRRTTASCASCH